MSHLDYFHITYSLVIQLQYRSMKERPTPKYIKDLHYSTSNIICTHLKQSTQKHTQHTHNREGKEKVTFQVGH